MADRDAGWVCSACGKRTAEARVWDEFTMCRPCTYRDLGACPMCGDAIRGVVTPIGGLSRRWHFSVEHTCTLPMIVRNAPTKDQP